MDRFYKKALDKLGIDQQTFDSIVFSSKEAEDKIVECLEYCFENVESLEYVSCFLIQYISEKKKEIKRDDAEEPKEWITVNGAPIPIDENGEMTGEIGEKIKSDIDPEKQCETKKNGISVSGNMKPESTDYEYESGESFEEFSHKNRKKLMDIYKQKKMDGVREEFYKYRMAETTKDLHEVSPDDANEILSRYIRQSDADGWFRSADSNYKPRIIAGVLSSPEARNAALSVMWENYKTNKDASGEKFEMSYEEWLVTPMKMYRGGTAADHTTNDIFSAYTPDKKVAEKFSVSGNIYEADIKPIDTFGSVFSNGEMEIMVPSMIAPNGNKDGRYDNDEEGEWITTENGHKVHLSESGEPDKCNYHVMQVMERGNGDYSEVIADSSAYNVKTSGMPISKEEIDRAISLVGINGMNVSDDYTLNVFKYNTENSEEYSDCKNPYGVFLRDRGNGITVEINPQEGNDLHIEFMEIDQKGKGTGTSVIKGIIEAAKECGVKKISLSAAGHGEKVGKNRNKFNGYYTWARLGFDCDFESEVNKRSKDKIHDAGFHPDKLSDLMETEEGRKCWKENGSDVYLEFDLSDDSKSMKIFESYIGRKDEEREKIEEVSFDSLFDRDKWIDIKNCNYKNKNKGVEIENGMDLHCSREDKKQNAKEIREAKKKNYKTPDGEKIAGFKQINGATVPIGKDGTPVGDLGEKIEKNEAEAKENGKINKNVLTENGEDDKIESEAERKIRLAEEKRKRKAEAKAEEERKKEEENRNKEHTHESDLKRRKELSAKKINGSITEEEDSELNEVIERERERCRSVANPRGKNKPCKGFSNKEKEKEHFEKHGVAEMGLESEEEYIRKGNELLTAECGGDIDGYMDSDGAICRFNRRTCEYVKGFPGGVMKTYFIPKYYDINGNRNLNWRASATNYFERMKRNEEYNGNS